MITCKKEIVHVYERFEMDTEEQILSGSLKAGDCIISENEAAERYGISRRSARTAIEHLIAKGLLIRRPGKGTFVAALTAGSRAGFASYSATVILPDLSDTFLLTVCEGIQEAAGKYNCDLIIKTSHGDIARENQNIRYCLQRRESGVIVFPNYGRGNLESLLKLKEMRIPFVLIDRKFVDLETNYIGVDNASGGYMACEHLIKTGCRKIAHLYGTNGSANDERLDGYRRALSDYGIPGSEKFIRRFSDLKNLKDSRATRFEPDMEGGYENMKFLLAQKEIPDGVFAGNDYQALGALRAIREAGLQIPGDVSVVGFDELRFNNYLEQPLTTIRQPQMEIGRKAMDILHQAILEKDDPFTPRIVKLPVSLVIGKTTRELP
ncbi:MAG: GntR family transcriptional regulator [Lentisphaeria bacterium]|nr:GntR family transcriptional regulator [Lentisphaeria bacterium]